MVNLTIYYATMGLQQWGCSQCCVMQQWASPLLISNDGTSNLSLVAFSNNGIAPIVAYVQDL